MASNNYSNNDVPERDVSHLYETGVNALEQVLQRAGSERNIELALACFSQWVWTSLGDPAAHLRKRALKKGEHQFCVSGFFLFLPAVRQNILVANYGFPEEQHRLRIPDNLGHPGWVTQNKKALLLENTDEHEDFKQILKTARMGSAMYSPMIWQGCFFGQLITASQARYTYGPHDHAIHRTFANASAAVFDSMNGLDFLKKLTDGL